MRMTLVCVTWRASTSSRLKRRSSSCVASGSESGLITFNASDSASSESQTW